MLCVRLLKKNKVRAAENIARIDSEGALLAWAVLSPSSEGDTLSQSIQSFL